MIEVPSGQVRLRCGSREGLGGDNTSLPGPPPLPTQHLQNLQRSLRENKQTINKQTKNPDQISSSWPQRWPQRSSQQSSQRSSQRSSQWTCAPLHSLHGASQGTLSPQGPGLRSGTAIGTNCRRQPSRPGAKGRYEKERKELRQAGGGGVTRARTRTSPGFSSNPVM